MKKQRRTADDFIHLLVGIAIARTVLVVEISKGRGGDQHRQRMLMASLSVLAAGQYWANTELRKLESLEPAGVVS